MRYLCFGILNALHRDPAHAAMTLAFEHLRTLKFTRPLAWSSAEGDRRGERARSGCGDTCDALLGDDYGTGGFATYHENIACGSCRAQVKINEVWKAFGVGEGKTLCRLCKWTKIHRIVVCAPLVC